MHLIEDFWIINFDGIPLFIYSSNDVLNPNLMSSFLSAIQQFSLQIHDEEEQYIDSFTLADSKFNFLINQKFKLYFVLKSSKDLHPKFVNKHLKQIKQMFVGDFSKDIETFDGEVSNFSRFKHKIEKYFKDKFLNFMDYLIKL